MTRSGAKTPSPARPGHPGKAQPGKPAKTAPETFGRFVQALSRLESRAGQARKGPEGAR